MKTTWRCLAALVICAGPAIADEPAVASKEKTTEMRETVLDRKVHIERDLILKIPLAARLCDTMDVTKRRVDVGGCTLYCEVEGQGFPVVLLHGGPGSTHHGFHPHLSRAKQFAKVIYYDQRGCGQSDYKPAGGYTIDQAVDDLEKLRKALGVDRWTVLGHSYGGLLAQCYVLKYPPSVAGLVLVGSALDQDIPLKPTRQSDFLSQEEKDRIRAIHGNRKLTVEQSIYNAFLNGDWKRQCYYRPSGERIARIALYEWKHDESFNEVMSADMQQVSLKGAFDECPIPTLIVEGRWDLTWNTDKPETLRKIHPRSELVVSEQSGHSPFEDEPEKFMAILKGFVQTAAPQSDADVLAWQEEIVRCRKAKASSPAALVRAAGWGPKSSATLSRRYTKEWLDELDSTRTLLRMGFAFYDTERYADALAVFQKNAEVARGNDVELAISLIWQAQMLDLLGRREEALDLYRRVAGMNVREHIEHSQYGLRYSPGAYAAERIAKPFVRIENNYAD